VSILKYEGRRDKWRIQNSGKQQKCYISSGHIPYQLHNPNTVYSAQLVRVTGLNRSPRFELTANMTGPLIAHWTKFVLFAGVKGGLRRGRFSSNCKVKFLDMKCTSYVSCPMFVPPSAGWIPFQDGGRTVLENVRTYHRAWYKNRENTPVIIFGPYCEGKTLVLR
jgi:hypothetical protein